MRHSPLVVEQIISLRERGLSVPEISKELGIPKTTVFHHARAVTIAPEHMTRYIARKRSSVFRSALQWKEARSWSDSIFAQNLSSRERLLILASLYWGEGNKKDLTITNSDPEMMAVVVAILRTDLGVEDAHFRLSIRLFEDMDMAKCKKFWLERLNLPESCFLAAHVQPGSKSGKLEHGMGRLRVTKGSLSLKKLFATKENITRSLAPVVQRIKQGTPNA